jgi:ERF superfamily
MISHPTGPIDSLTLQGPLPLPRPTQSTGEHLGKLAAKLVRVMGAISHIPKRGHNDFFNYDYATDADVADAVRKALVAEGVILIPSIEDVREREVVTRKQQKEIVTTVTMTFTFIDGEHGGSLTFRMSGAGQDGGDKGIMKAITAATKYAALKALCLPTGDDPEAEDTPAPQAAPHNGRQATPPPDRESPQPSSPPWQDTPWPDEDTSPKLPPRASRATPREPRDPSRPRVEDCISEGKLKRLHAIMQTKARDYEWEFERLRAYVKEYALAQFGIAHLSDIPWRGRAYEDICTWVEALGAP